MTFALTSALDVLPAAMQAGDERVTYLADLTTQTGVSLQGVILAICGTILGALIGIRALGGVGGGQAREDGHPDPGRRGGRGVLLFPGRIHGNAEIPVHVGNLGHHTRRRTQRNPPRAGEPMALQLPTDTASLRLETKQYELFNKRLGNGIQRRVLTIGVAVAVPWVSCCCCWGCRCFPGSGRRPTSCRRSSWCTGRSAGTSPAGWPSWAGTTRPWRASLLAADRPATRCCPASPPQPGARNGWP